MAEKLNDWFLACGTPEPQQPILTDARGKRLTRGQLSHLIKTIAREAGITRIKVTPHVLRHSLNVIRRMGGIDTTLRSALRAHSSPGSLISYEHTAPEELIAARAQQRKAVRDYVKNPKELWRLPPSSGSK